MNNPLEILDAINKVSTSFKTYLSKYIGMALEDAFEDVNVALLQTNLNADVVKEHIMIEIESEIQTIGLGNRIESILSSLLQVV